MFEWLFPLVFALAYIGFYVWEWFNSPRGELYRKYPARPPFEGKKFSRLFGHMECGNYSVLYRGTFYCRISENGLGLTTCICVPPALRRETLIPWKKVKLISLHRDFINVVVDGVSIGFGGKRCIREIEPFVKRMATEETSAAMR